MYNIDQKKKDMHEAVIRLTDISPLRACQKNTEVSQVLIDFHTHCFNDRLAGRAIEKLSKAANIPAYTNGTVDDTRAKMHEWGVDYAVVHNITVTVQSQTHVNDFAIELLKYEDIIPFGSVHPMAENALDELDRLYSAGVRGIKLHPEYQGFDINDRIAYPIYERIAELGLVMLFHGGWDAAYPDSERATAEKCASFLDDFEGAKIVLAHLGGMMQWDKIPKLIAGRDVYMDISMLPGYCDPMLAKKIIDRHSPDRLLFGSDCPWCTVPKMHEFIDKLELDDKTLEKLYWKNAVKILGLEKLTKKI